MFEEKPTVISNMFKTASFINYSVFYINHYEINFIYQPNFDTSTNHWTTQP